MRFFKNPTNEVFAIAEHQSYLIRADWTEITEVEKEQLLSAQTNKGSETLTEKRISDIKDRLMEIDVESIRPLRAIATQTDQLLDHQKLAKLNAERKDLLLELGEKNR